MEDTHTEHQPLLDQEMSRQEEGHQVPEAREEEERRPVVLYKGIQQREASQLQCPIHKGLMHDPVGTGKCKHVFCRSCLASWVALQGHCPLDARPAQVDQLWGVVQDEETGAWVAASGEGYCPALIAIGDRKAHEDSCAYRPAVLQSDEATGGAAGQLMNRLQFPQVQVNVELVMQALRTNLTRFERVLADRMDVRSLIEEQNIHRLRSGASGAMANFKEEMEAAIAGLMEKQAPLFRSIATKSESLCSEASSVARAKGNALYEGAVHMRHQAAVAGGEAINRLDVLAQELMGEVKLALMRSLEPQSCPTPPPPPPPDFVLEEEQEAEAQEEEEQEQEAELKTRRGRGRGAASRDRTGLGHRGGRRMGRLPVLDPPRDRH
ncbi:uncharacterized protein ACA1_028170 [Acanthamoeba castellanii str. Neff]|uniref:RING-type domain-containing protein n=1 Tax=Acanthamoeba castellanii (strain ATCC 30010 / Neff) TaxID=1257118 RepID=L8GID2_ACACF|nr:uncharacterized protein ACA1_028170 [Acanthamoeba castellanii str. Neff]ELR12513.1 hypothetical protein ACA1_028170 [Acanthamoeba castellanii str. Neff]